MVERNKRRRINFIPIGITVGVLFLLALNQMPELMARINHPPPQLQLTVVSLQSENVSPFVTLFSPTGITSDLDGNVIINSVSGFNQIVTSFNPSGVPLHQINLTTQIGSSSMVIDSTTNLGIMLFSTGDLLIFDPVTLEFVPWFNLRASADIDTSNIYDVATQTFGPMAGLIQPQFAHYGDLALYRNDDQLDLFVTGVSSVFPFVLRIHFPDNNSPAVMQVILASSATTAPENNLATWSNCQS
jgi:hypothetical protein